MCAVVDLLYLSIGNISHYASNSVEIKMVLSVMLLSKLNSKQLKPTHGDSFGEQDTLHMLRSHGV